MIHSVSDITRYIKGLLQNEQLLQNLLIGGEISYFKCYSSGHCYFTLKDSGACIKCVMFKSRAQGLRFRPENGMAVIVRGNIAVYERDGVYQLYADSMTPQGAGELALAFEQLKKKLSAEGLFEDSHKKPLPFFPKRIGVVTSPSGAVLRDIYHVSKQRNPGIRLVLYPVQVQGEAAAEEISRGIRFFNENYPVDVLIVGRGGGSAEDLWAFNEEPVVRAIYDSNIPVISAVGHETDFTLADFAADRRAATPSHAAELAVPDTRELQHRLAVLAVRMTTAARHQLQIKRERLTRCRKSTILERPHQFLDKRRQRLDIAVLRLSQLKTAAIQGKRHRLELALQRLDMLNPARVLRRGYSIVENENGVVRKANEVSVGDNLTVILSDGRLNVNVTGTSRTVSRKGRTGNA